MSGDLLPFHPHPPNPYWGYPVHQSFGHGFDSSTRTNLMCVTVKLASASNGEEDTASKMMIRSTVRNADPSQQGSFQTVGMWARQCVQESQEWLVKIAKRDPVVRAMKRGSVLITFGDGYDLLVILDGASTPQDLRRVHRVGVAVCIAKKDHIDDASRLAEYGFVRASDSIWDHISTSNPESVRVYLHTDLPPFTSGNEAVGGYRTLLVTTNKANPFIADYVAVGPTSGYGRHEKDLSAESIYGPTTMTAVEGVLPVAPAVTAQNPAAAQREFRNLDIGRRFTASELEELKKAFEEAHGGRNQKEKNSFRAFSLEEQNDLENAYNLIILASRIEDQQDDTSASKPSVPLLNPTASVDKTAEPERARISTATKDHINRSTHQAASQGTTTNTTDVRTAASKQKTPQVLLGTRDSTLKFGFTPLELSELEKAYEDIAAQTSNSVHNSDGAPNAPSKHDDKADEVSQSLSEKGIDASLDGRNSEILNQNDVPSDAKKLINNVGQPKSISLDEMAATTPASNAKRSSTQPSRKRKAKGSTDLTPQEPDAKKASASKQQATTPARRSNRNRQQKIRDDGSVSKRSRRVIPVS